MRYRLLGSSGLRVSELCLGTMTFGEDWGWGASKAESREIFDTFVQAGGNFIDTANLYTNGSSEAFLGEFIQSERERIVLATKYSLTTRADDPNGGGNSRKNMIQSVEASLERLDTPYIDLFWLHAWDGMTPIEEVMRGLDDLVRAGKIMYVGLSDTPAWVVSRAHLLAQLRGWAPIVALQAPYSLVRRDVERELLPMAKALDIAVTPWGLLAGGVLSGKYDDDDASPKRYEKADVKPARLEMARTLGRVASEVGCTAAQLAIAWVLHQQHRAEILPILGARTTEQLEGLLACPDIDLTEDQIATLEAASGFEPGFPTDFLSTDNIRGLLNGENADNVFNHRE